MLETLPSELLSKIASHLSYKDITSLRQALTRGDLDDALNAHAVWLNLAIRYLAENPYSHLSNLRSLFSLTTGQLRQRFEKRLMANYIWPLSKEIYPSVKRLKYPSSPILTIKIAPGGRWVFGGAKKCTLYYWDLDSDDPEPCVLAPVDGVRNIPGRTCSIVKIDFIVEHGDPFSGFVIAFVGCDLDSYHHGMSREWLYIWDVKPREGNGTLEATRRKALPLPYDASGPRLSLNEHMVARYMKTRLDVYWWKDCTETHLVRCTLAFQKKNSIITNIYVLGSDKILVYAKYYENNHKVRLYALQPGHSEVGHYWNVVSHATKIWSLRFRCHYSGNEISGLYFDGTNYHQTIATLDGIFGLIIPAFPANKPTLEKLSDFNLYQRQYDGGVYGLGLNKGYCKTRQKLCRFGYSWGPMREVYENGANFDSNLDRILQNLENSHSFDEELGRLVSIPENQLVLQDFSLPLYSVADVCPGDPDCTIHENVPK